MSEKKLSEYAKEIGELVEQKDKAYGNAFDKAGDFLKILYPNGITPDKYADMLCLVRIFDKQMRIATSKNAFSENPFFDITGYGLLGCRMSEKQSQKQTSTALEKLEAMEDEGKDL